MSARLTRRLYGSVCACALAGLGGLAHAQTIAASGGAAAAPPTTTDGPSAISEVIVTAQKRSEKLQDTPLTIGVVRGTTLTELGVSSLFNTAPLVAGMVFSRAPDDGLGLTFRGVGTPARNQSFDQSIALFIDGAFVGKGRLYGANMFDVDHIEFIKSTESTLLGKNTDLGAISVVTRQPGSTFEGDASVGARLDQSGYILDGGVDVPLTQELAIRVAAHANDTDGWVQNSYNGDVYPEDKDYGARLTAVYRPSDLVKLAFSYQYTFDHRIGNGFQYVDPDHTLPPALGEGVLDDHQDAYTSAGEDGQSTHKLTAHIANLTADVDVGGSKLTSITSYMTYGLHFVDDFDFGPKDGNAFIRNEQYWQVSQELRLASSTTQRFSYLIGASAFYSDWNSDELQKFDTPLQVGPTPFDTVFLGSFDDQFKQRTLNVALFGEATWKITERLRFSGGLRLSQEDKSGSWARPAFAPFTLWNEVLNPPFPKTPLSFDAFLPDANASLQYDASQNLMLYASVGQGSKTGGFAESSSVPTGNPAVDARVGNEISRSVEIGAKSTLFDHTAHLNLALFFVDIPKFQDTNFTGAAFVSRNIPVQSYGVDAEFVWRATHWLTFDNAWTYDHAEALLTPSFSPSQSPRWSSHSGLIAQTPILDGAWQLKSSAVVRYRSRMHNIDSYVYTSAPLTTLDLTLGAGPADGRWLLELVATNVTNAISADFSFPPPDPTLAPSVRIESPTPARQITLRASARF